MPGLDLLLLLDCALEGDERQRTRLVEALLPEVREGVVSALKLMHRFYRPDSLDDLAQDTLVVLFKDQAAVLRKFDPAVATGNLAAYVRTVAKKTTISKLRRSKSGRGELPTAPEDLPERDGTDPEAAIASRDLLLKLVSVLPRAGVQEEGLELFRLHFIDGHRGVDIAAHLGLEVDAVHQRLHRMRTVLDKLIQKIEAPRRET